MATQDFAQVGSSSDGESNSGGSSILSAVAIIVIAGLSFTTGFWLGSGDAGNRAPGADMDALQGKLAAQEATNRLLQAKSERLEEMVAEWKSRAEADAHEKVGELTFYKELPKQKVEPAPVATVSPVPVVKQAAPAVKPAVTKTAGSASATVPQATAGATAGASQAGGEGHYRLQLASFRTEADAISMQNKLSASGFHSQVQQVDLDEKGTWYRLYAGPYATKADAEAARPLVEARLKLKHLLIRER